MVATSLWFHSDFESLIYRKFQEAAFDDAIHTLSGSARACLEDVFLSHSVICGLFAHYLDVRPAETLP